MPYIYIYSLYTYIYIYILYIFIVLLNDVAVAQNAVARPEETRANLMEDLSILAVIGEGMTPGAWGLGTKNWPKDIAMFQKGGIQDG